METIYFDYASTTPVDPAVFEVMAPYFSEKFGNASSPHGIGREASKALEEARENVAQFLTAKPHEIIFNSGATEGNNHAIFGMAQALKNKGRHIIISAIEHHSVWEPAQKLSQEGYEVTYLPVDKDGIISLEELNQSIKEETFLVAVMHASNEIGTMQPMAEISEELKKRNIPLLVDVCQTVGHVPVDVNALGADILTFSAHKFYGPKGMGAMYIREKTPLASFLLGGDQEKKRRASTQNVAGAVGLSKALDLCREKMSEEANHQINLRDQLLQEIPKRITGVKVNGSLTQRLPNNAHFSFENIQGESLLMSLDMNHMAASMGSACTAGALEPSHVLRAIGLSDELAHGSLRISLGRWSTQEHIDHLLEKLPSLVEGLRL